MAGRQRPRGRARPGRLVDVRGLDVGGSGTDTAESPRSVPETRAALYARSVAGGAERALTRQLASARAVLPMGAVIVGVFADVCAWNAWPPDPVTTTTASPDPSICTGWTLGGHTVEGGMLTLLRRARQRVPDFDLVGCEDGERLSRKLWRQTLIEDALRACGVHVAIATEGAVPRGGHTPLSVVLSLGGPIAPDRAG